MTTTNLLTTLNAINARTTDPIINAEAALTELYDMKDHGLNVRKAIRKQQKFIEHLKN